MKLIKYFFSVKRIFLYVLLSFLGIVFSNVWIKQSTKNNIYDDQSSIPFNSVGLLLGANKRTSYFHYRVEAAVKLFKQGKIKHILVSGDNHTSSYDEATDMKTKLISKGIPGHRITMDFAGFRTLDSVVRSKKVFGQSNITIISQRFHLERALFIASKKGINAIGFCAKDPGHNRTTYREYLAKVKAVIDLYLLNKQPKFLGKKEPISI